MVIDFLTVKIIKSCLRTLITEFSLADIALLSIENDLSNTVSLDDVVTDFGGSRQEPDNNTLLIILSTTVHGVVSSVII